MKKIKNYVVNRMKEETPRTEELSLLVGELTKMIVAHNVTYNETEIILRSVEDKIRATALIFSD